MRYFRSAPAVYLFICQQLDAAYEYPNTATKTERALPVVGDLPADDQGRVYLAIAAEYCKYELPSRMLPQLISGGAIEEIDSVTYLAVVNPGP